MSKIKVTQIKSGIKKPQNQKRTLEALGLKKIGQVVEHEATPRGSFLLRVEASSTKGDSAYSPPRMMVRVGTKSGVGLEPHKVLGQVDVRTQAGEVEIYEFKGNFEDFPSHEPGIEPKFPGLRFYVTDRNAVLPQVSRENKAAATTRTG